jgi:hypothetical protein
MSFCDQCGSSLEDGDKFCTSCGAAVATPKASAESAETYNAGTYIEQSSPTSLTSTPLPQVAGGTSSETETTTSSSDSELATDPWKMPSRKVLLLISAALALFFGGVAYGIVRATSDSPPNATSSSTSSSSKTTTTTVGPTTTTQPKRSRTSLRAGFSSNVPALLRESILRSQPNLAALDTFVSIVDDPSYPSWVEVCAQDAGPTSPGAAKGYANEVDGQWNFTGFGTAWVPPFPLDLTQAIVNSFRACP